MKSPCYEDVPPLTTGNFYAHTVRSRNILKISAVARLDDPERVFQCFRQSACTRYSAINFISLALTK